LYSLWLVPTLKTEAVYFYETLISTYESTRCYDPNGNDIFSIIRIPNLMYLNVAAVPDNVSSWETVKIG
jgi:hypothetical protein